MAKLPAELRRMRDIAPHVGYLDEALKAPPTAPYIHPATPPDNAVQTLDALHEWCVEQCFDAERACDHAVWRAVLQSYKRTPSIDWLPAVTATHAAAKRVLLGRHSTTASSLSPELTTALMRWLREGMGFLAPACGETQRLLLKVRAKEQRVRR